MSPVQKGAAEKLGEVLEESNHTDGLESAFFFCCCYFSKFSLIWTEKSDKF